MVPVYGCPADLDQDGEVGLNDLTILLTHYDMLSALPSEGDVDGDVDLDDRTLLVQNFGQVCP